MELSKTYVEKREKKNTIRYFPFQKTKIQSLDGRKKHKTQNDSNDSFRKTTEKKVTNLNPMELDTFGRLD